MQPHRRRRRRRSVSVAGSVVTVTPVSAGESVVTVTATDAGGSNRTATQTFTVTVAQDADGDGLIGIHTPAQLDAVRHDLDGDGAPTTAGAAGHAAVFGVTGGGTLSCAVAGGRRGYELRADLDFDTNGGGGPDAGGRLRGRQRRSGDGQLRHRAGVGKGGSYAAVEVSGSTSAGGLVGTNAGRIAGSYATGRPPQAPADYADR